MLPCVAMGVGCLGMFFISLIYSSGSLLDVAWQSSPAPTHPQQLPPNNFSFSPSFVRFFEKVSKSSSFSSSPLLSNLSSSFTITKEEEEEEKKNRNKRGSTSFFSPSLFSYFSSSSALIPDASKDYTSSFTNFGLFVYSPINMDIHAHKTQHSSFPLPLVSPASPPVEHRQLTKEGEKKETLEEDAKKIVKDNEEDEEEEDSFETLLPNVLKDFQNLESNISKLSTSLRYLQFQYHQQEFVLLFCVFFTGISLVFSFYVISVVVMSKYFSFFSSSSSSFVHSNTFPCAYAYPFPISENKLS